MPLRNDYAEHNAFSPIYYQQRPFIAKYAMYINAEEEVNPRLSFYKDNNPG